MVLVAVQVIDAPGARVAGAAGVQLSAESPVSPVSVTATPLRLAVPVFVVVKV